MSAMQENILMPDMVPRPPDQRPRKRRRRTMACMQCRSRKLKCDREYPTCGRCMKSKTPTKCTYEDGFLWQQPTIASSSFSDRASAGAAMPRLSGMPAECSSSADSGLTPVPTRAAPMMPERPLGEERRDRFLETVLSASNPTVVQHQQPPYRAGELFHATPAPPNAVAAHSRMENHCLVSPSQPLDMPNKSIIRGKDTQTRFIGSGIVANLLLQFTDLKPFVEELRLANPNLSRMRQDVDMIKRGGHKKRQPLPFPDTASFIAMIPSREVVDQLVDLYLVYIESTHRILHIPSFRREVDEIWEKKNNPNSIPTTSVVQLLLVLACAWNLTEADRLSNMNFSSLALDWITQADTWLRSTFIKRPDITTLRIHCLLQIAKNNQGLKRSQAWLATGTLVKLAMMAGYHRELDQRMKVSTFHREMRRRIWTTIVELDLQVALDRGMTPTVQPSDFDAGPALNINDDEINEDTVELPPSRPLEEITDSSFQCALAQSLPLRLKACTMMNSPTVTCSYEDIQKMDFEFTRLLSAIPDWPTSGTMDSIADQKTTLWTALIEAKIAQALLSIHTPFAIDAAKEPIFTPSSRARFEAATVILARQQLMHDTSTRLSFCNLSDTTLQAALSICQHLYTIDDYHASKLIRRSVPGFTDALLLMVEKTLKALEDKILVVAKGAKHYFFLTMIYALVKSKLRPEQADLYKKETGDRITSLAFRLLCRDTDASDPRNAAANNNKHNRDKRDQAAKFTPGSEQAPLFDSFDGIFPQIADFANFAITPPEDFETFLNAFNWEDLAEFPYGE